MTGARNARRPYSDEQIRDTTLGELRPLDTNIQIVDYDARWPEVFAREAERMRAALGARALQVEHTGSTSVPSLPAKPIIDIVLAVADSAHEAAFVPPLTAIGYTLRIREPQWHEHRMLVRSDPAVNLHVFSSGCPEIERMLTFRDWLRTHPEDREQYARAKRDLTQKKWKYVQNYADAKTAIVNEIMARATAK